MGVRLLMHLGLLDAVSAGGPEGEIDPLEALHALDQRLARYESTVTRACGDGRGAVGQPLGADRPGAPGPHRPGAGAMGQTVE